MSQSTWNQIRHIERCSGDSLVRLAEDGIIGERWLETLLATKTKSLKPSRDPRLKLAKEDTWSNVTMLIIEDHCDTPMCQAVWEVVWLSGCWNLKRVLMNSTWPGAWACDGPWTLMVYEFLRKTAQKLHIWPCGKSKAMCMPLWLSESLQKCSTSPCFASSFYYCPSHALVARKNEFHMKWVLIIKENHA